MKPNRLVFVAIAAITLALVGELPPAQAGKSSDDLDAKVQAALHDTFGKAPAAWQARLKQDELQKQCSVHRDQPPADVAKAILASQRADVVYSEGSLIGDWKAGEKLAQNGKGLQFSDKPGIVNGGNCYACHQLTQSEIAYGTVGPSLYHYGKRRGSSDAIVKYTYGKIYNAEAFVPCSLMPRFGAQHILSEKDIEDLVALLLDPASPVNQ